MISGIGSGGYSMSTQMTAMQGQRENPFKKLDSNNDGSLDKTEISALVSKISESTSKSIDADQLITKLDADKNGLVSQKEFDSGRPPGPPPGMIGGGMSSGGMQGSSGTKNGSSSSSTDSSDSSSTDPLDTNGDGTVSAEELLAGIKNLIQKYQDQATTLNQNGGAGSLFNLQG